LSSEGDPFQSDTFEIAFLGRHLNPLSLRLGPQVMAEDFAFGPLASYIAWCRSEK
jgi:hypothetical protein